MLILRPSCENCNKLLPPDSHEAMICSFECTYCVNCVDNIFKGVCPSCGGNFSLRPIRPADKLLHYPASTEVVFNPIKN